MQEVKEFLRACDIFFIATDEGSQPRVRPFGALAEFEQKLYICTNNTKPCFAQMLANPKVEICAMGPDHQWLRLTAVVTRDTRREAKAAMLEQCPGLRRMYSEDDGKFEVLSLSDCVASFCTLTGEPRIVRF